MSLESPRLVDAGPLRIAGLEQSYQCDNTSSIAAQWDRFGPYIGGIPGQVGGVAYGVSHEMHDNAFRYLSGVEVTPGAELPEGFTAVQLPAQRYAAFPHRGHLSTLCQTIGAIWSEWLPQSGHAVADTPVMFERYGESFDPKTGAGDIEVWLAIK